MRYFPKEILADSFRELAGAKAVDAITVREIVSNCGYSQATFYRQFRDKYDLIAWDYSRRVAEIMDQVGADGKPWRQTTVEGAQYFERQRAYLANLFLHTTGLDSFVRNMVETNYRYLRECVTRAMGGEAPDERADMCIRLYCHGTVDLTCEWVLGKYQASAETLAEVFQSSLPEPLRPWLCDEA